MNSSLSILSLLLLLGCASRANSVYIKSETDLSLDVLDEKGQTQKKLVRAGEVHRLEGWMTHVESSGRIPIVLVQGDVLGKATSEENPWIVNLKKVEEWKAPATQEYITKEFDQLTVQLLDFLQDAKNGRKDQSLSKIDSLIQRYPKVSALHYVKAQIELLSGKSKEALKSVNTAIELNPGLTGAILLREKINKKADI